MRRKNKLDMTITEQLDFAVDQLCENYCKYRQQYKDGNMKKAWLKDTYCKSCPAREI